MENGTQSPLEVLRIDLLDFAVYRNHKPRSLLGSPCFLNDVIKDEREL